MIDYGDDINKYIANCGVSDEARAIIDPLSDKRKAEMACDFNCWRFPPELKQFQPEWYDENSLDMEKMHPVIGPYRIYLEASVGDKVVSREWWRRVFPEKTDQDHEDWWNNGRHSRPPLARPIVEALKSMGGEAKKDEIFETVEAKIRSDKSTKQ